MNKPFGLSEKDSHLVTKILRTFLPDAKFFVFGSRARGDQKKYSDLDLAIENHESIPLKILMQIQENFDQSSLPFKVDLIELAKISPEFKKNILEDLIEWTF